MSPGVTGKSERAGHNSVALPTAAGRREGDRICPALTDFPVTPGDLHSTAVLGSSDLRGAFACQFKYTKNTLIPSLPS